MIVATVSSCREPDRILHNPLYGGHEKPRSYVDNPAYNSASSQQPAAEKLQKDEAAYTYVDHKSSHSYELVEVPSTAQYDSESNHNMDGGNEQEPEYANLKPTTAVYQNIGHPDSQTSQEEFYSHLTN